MSEPFNNVFPAFGEEVQFPYGSRYFGEQLPRGRLSDSNQSSRSSKSQWSIIRGTAVNMFHDHVAEGFGAAMSTRSSLTDRMLEELDAEMGLTIPDVAAVDNHEHVEHMRLYLARLAHRNVGIEVDSVQATNTDTDADEACHGRVALVKGKDTIHQAQEVGLLPDSQVDFAELMRHLASTMVAIFLAAGLLVALDRFALVEASQVLYYGALGALIVAIVVALFILQR